MYLPHCHVNFILIRELKGDISGCTLFPAQSLFCCQFPPGLHTKVRREYRSGFFEPTILFVCSIHPFPTNLNFLWSILPAAATRWQHLCIVLHTLPGPMWNAVLCPGYKSSYTLLRLLSNQLASCLITRCVCLSKPLTDMKNFKGNPTYVYRAQTSLARAG